MKMFKLGAVAGLALAVAACPPADRNDVAITEDTIMRDTPVAEQPGMMAPATAERANLEAIGGSGVSGEVHVTPRDNEVQIVMQVQNAPPNESLGVRVHSGTCQSPGPELARLDAISTDDLGQGRSESNVGHAPHLILDGNHIVAVHRPGADPEVDTPIACATLPEHAMGAMGRPGTTGTGTGGY